MTDEAEICVRCDVDPCVCDDELPGGPSPRWVSGEKYDFAYRFGRRRSRQVAQLTEALLAIDSAAIPLGATADGFTAVGYYVPIGPLHKALGVIGHSGARNADLIDPPLPPDWWMHLLRRAVERTDATEIPPTPTASKGGGDG